LFEGVFLCLASFKISCGCGPQHRTSALEADNCAIGADCRCVIRSALVRRDKNGKQASACILNLFPLREGASDCIENLINLRVASLSGVADFPGVLRHRERPDEGGYATAGCAQATAIVCPSPLLRPLAIAINTTSAVPAPAPR
jgi:hypothetical protein